MSLHVLAVADQVSDLLYDYFRKARWEHVDLVLSCGDLPPSYLDFLLTAVNVPVFYVRGNHDATFREDEYDGCINCHGTIVEYKGIRIAGFEGCRRYNQGEYQYSEREMNRDVQRVNRKARRGGAPDIVLTHAPPAGLHDAEDLPHRGFECFNRAIEMWQPKYFVHGHMHKYQMGEQVTQVGDTTVMNAFLFREFEIAQPVPAEVPEPSARRIFLPGNAGRFALSLLNINKHAPTGLPH